MIGNIRKYAIIISHESNILLFACPNADLRDAKMNNYPDIARGIGSCFGHGMRCDKKTPAGAAED